MKNIVTFDVRGNCACAFMGNIFDGTTNDVDLIFEADTFENPKIEILPKDAESSTFQNLTVENGVAVGKFPLYIFYMDDAPLSCQIRYADGDKLGTWFTWVNFNILAGLLETGSRTLRVYKSLDINKNATFSLKWVMSKQTPVETADPNSFDVNSNGELSLKTPINVSVTTSSDDQITNVDFEYKDNEHKSFAVEWNTDGKITKFGHLPITWE